MSLSQKIISAGHLAQWRAALEAAGKTLVVTNGCFDILHAGHVMYLEKAHELGDALLVGLNADASVSALKGPGRPVNNEHDRAVVLAGLESVGAIYIFSERTAVRFLQEARPDIYVKGGDQNLSTVPAEELEAIKHAGGKVVFAPLMKWKSSTAILDRISKL